LISGSAFARRGTGSGSACMCYGSRRPLVALVTLALGFSLAAASSGDAGGRKAVFPRPVGYVSDFADFISPRAETAITRIAREVKEKTGAEIAVVTVETTGGRDIEEYAVSLFTDWGIGEKGKDNGVLLVVAAGDHRMWIKPGYGLEGAIPDAKAYRIYRDVLSRGFRAGKSDQALVTAVNLMAEAILTESGQSYAYRDSVPDDLVLAREAGERDRAGDGKASLRSLVAMGFMLFLSVIVIVIMGFASRYGYRRGRGGGFWIGGFGGSGGGFGGGFGGFGGGSCGGGGAGGGW